MYEIFVGIDPGINGALAVLDITGIDIKAEVFQTPTKTIIKNKKNKKDYDIEAMASILEKYKNSNIIVAQEATHAMPQQGTTSMYSFGRGAGIWEGIVGAYHMKVIFVPPFTWKSTWPDDLLKKVDKPDILRLKPVEVNRLSAADRKKHKDAKKEYKKKQDKAKKLAKDNARELAKRLYYNLKDSFELKKDDGKAEAVLIAEHIRRYYNG